ncbi:MAG TPA: helix-turn-helix domain-containing protein [Solirubrobacteraceae bacterium]|jgi:DNA-binding transcriptional ArsR family regulator
MKSHATAKPSAEHAVMSVLSDLVDGTVAEIATAGKLGRSTVSKALAKLESAGEVKRREGGRDGARRLPDRWRLARRRARKTRSPAGGRLRPGQLDGLVLGYMREHATGGPLGPTAVAKGLGRSAGAVGNCLARLAADRHVRQTSKHPRRYTVR